MSNQSECGDEQKSRPLHIVFVSRLDLPEGNGGTSRLKSLAGVLSKEGHHVSILNEHALGVAPLSVQRPRGVLCGAEYEYVLGDVERRYGAGSFNTKRKAVAAIWNRIKMLSKEGKIELLWFINLSLYDTYPLTILARRLGIPTVQEYVDERLELVTDQRISFARRVFAFNAYLADLWCPAMADGIVVISSYLMDKYARLSRDPSKVHLIPTVIDCDVWQCGPEVAADVPTILYTGYLGEQDEMENILIALARLRDNGISFKFRMLGGNLRAGEGEREKIIQAQIKDLNLTSMVEQRGFIPLDEVRSELGKANILVNIRRDGILSRSGLSTKLSEYLASGRLVISSDVGDVSRYLKHDESALLVSSKCATEEIEGAFRRALSSTELRARIGKMGRKVALDNFDVPIAQKRFRSLFNSILPRHVRRHVANGGGK